MTDDNSLSSLCNRITASIKAGRFIRYSYDYDLNRYLLMLEAIGKGYNDDFLLDTDYIEPYTQMLKYFMGDITFNGDLYRGLLLKGKVGCGKSLAFIVFSKFLHISGIAKNQYGSNTQPGYCGYSIIRSRDVRALYEDTEPGKGGDSSIKHFKFSKDIICFNDLGEEVRYGNIASHYGNQCNVMEEILTARYENFLVFGTITHCSTNYNFESGGVRYFKDFYGERVEDRMKEMFNEIVFKGESKRKRL